MKIDLDQIRDLLEIVAKTEITELSIQLGEEKVTIKKSPTTVIASELPTQEIVVKPAAAVAEVSFEPKSAPVQTAPGKEASTDHLVPVTAPMVGTFYRSASPTASPYVEVGDRITAGQTICIIEAMKLMNDMPTEVSGRIVKICVENGSTVEYGQQLFLIDPKG